jgi:hypothetical protein
MGGLLLFRNLKVSLLEAGLRERGGGASGDGDGSGGDGEGDSDGSRGDGEATAQREGSMGARDGGEPRPKKKEQQHLLSNPYTRAYGYGLHTGLEKETCILTCGILTRKPHG